MLSSSQADSVSAAQTQTRLSLLHRAHFHTILRIMIVFVLCLCVELRQLVLCINTPWRL